MKYTILSLVLITAVISSTNQAGIWPANTAKTLSKQEVVTLLKAYQEAQNQGKTETTGQKAISCQKINIQHATCSPENKAEITQLIDKATVRIALEAPKWRNYTTDQHSVEIEIPHNMRANNLKEIIHNIENDTRTEEFAVQKTTSNYRESVAKISSRVVILGFGCWLLNFAQQSKD